MLPQPNSSTPSSPYLYAVQTPCAVKNETHSSWMKQFIVGDVSGTNGQTGTHHTASNT